MSKGNKKQGNREAKKPKQPPKLAPAPATGFEKGVSPVADLTQRRKK